MFSKERPRVSEWSKTSFFSLFTLSCYLNSFSHVSILLKELFKNLLLQVFKLLLPHSSQIFWWISVFSPSLDLPATYDCYLLLQVTLSSWLQVFFPSSSFSPMHIICYWKRIMCTSEIPQVSFPSSLLPLPQLRPSASLPWTALLAS